MPGPSFVKVFKQAKLEIGKESAEKHLRTLASALQHQYITPAVNSSSRGQISITIDTLKRAKKHYDKQMEQLVKLMTATASINHKSLDGWGTVRLLYERIIAMEQALAPQISRTKKTHMAIPAPLSISTPDTTAAFAHLPSAAAPLGSIHSDAKEVLTTDPLSLRAVSSASDPAYKSNDSHHEQASIAIQPLVTPLSERQEAPPVSNDNAPVPLTPDTQTTEQTKLLPAQDRYKQELKNLRTACDRQSTELQGRINALIAQIEKNKSKKQTSDELEYLILILSNTTKLLSTSDYTHQEYEAFAKHTQGKSSTAMKVIGGLMIALAFTALIVVSGIVFCPAIAAIAGTVAIATAVSTTVQATISGATAGVLGIGGAYAFFSGCRKGVSAAMGGVAQDVALTAPAYTSTRK